MNTRTIARNSAWLGVEFIIDIVGTTATSIAVARVLGPVELGYYVYISWLANISMMLGNVGVPAAAVKYMAESWGRNDRALTRGLYENALRIQCYLAIVISVSGMAVAYLWGNPAYRLPSIILMLSVLPAMLNSIPTAANLAVENSRANVPGSLASVIIYSAGVVLTLVFGWKLTGVAGSLVLGRTAEMLIRLLPVRRWMQRVPRAEIPVGMRSSLVRFSGQGLVLMILGFVVWDRSEIVFLKNFYPDVKHVAFYSLAFSTAENVLRLIRVFTSSVAATMRVQYGRDRAGFALMLPITARYIALIAFPLYAGLASLSAPAIRIAYGSAYAPAIPVLMICALFAIPKAFQVSVQVFLQSAERQGFVVWWGIVSAVVNLTLDWLLIPRYGAIGAAYGNGVAQLFGVAGLWVGAVRIFDLKLPYASLFRSLAAATVMGVPVWLISLTLRAIPAMIVGIPVGVVIFFWMVRVLRVLDENDRRRLSIVRAGFPGTFGRWFDSVITVLIQAPSK